MRAIGVVSLWAVAAGCSGDLPPESRVDKLRLLAVRAEPPEVMPGMPSALDTLTVWPPSAPAPTLTYLWMACLESPGASSPTACGVTVGGNGGPTFSESALPDCATSASSNLCRIAITPTASYTPTDTASGGQVILTVIVADPVAGGATQCATDAASNGGAPTNPDHCIVALKRLTVGNNPSPNHNPTLDSLSFGGNLPMIGSSTAITLDAHRTPGSAETKPDGTVEDLLLAWYDTAGTLSTTRTEFRPSDCDDTCMKSDPPADSSSSWTAPNASDAAQYAPTNEIDFWVVIRDDRGGIGWKTASGKLP
jgi:hypothetical protein